jgi:hypothetical protein
MKLCSFDVGIKNLSYCITDFNDDKYDILEWENIDLIDSNIKDSCDGFLKNKSSCTKNASYKVDKSYYCKSHLKQYKKPETELIFKSYDCKERCENLNKKNNKCNGKIRFILNENPLCLKCKKTLEKQEEQKYKPEKIKARSCSAITTEEISLNIIKKLDKIPSLLNCDQILIENQPSLKNPKMKSIANFIYFYFTIRGINDKKSIKHVNFISPSNKIKANETNLKLVLDTIDNDSKIIKNVKTLLMKYHKLEKTDNEKLDEMFKQYNLIDLSKNIILVLINRNIKLDNIDFIKKLMKTDKKPIYDITKNLGIVYTRILTPDKWKNYLDDYSKKDDLCDAFLQSFYFYYKNKLSK